MAAMQPSDSRLGDLAPSPPPKSMGVAMEKWRALVMTDDYHHVVPSSDTGGVIPMNLRIQHNGKSVFKVYKNELGWALEQRGSWIRTQFVRHGKPVYIPVPTSASKLGKTHVPYDKKLKALQSLDPSRAPSTAVDANQWKTQGSPVERYIRTLWVTIRDNREALAILGLNSWQSKHMFDDQYFFRNVDRVIKLIDPGLKNVLNRPNFNLRDVVENTTQQTNVSPRDGQEVIYIRVYTRLDKKHENSFEAAVYVGQSVAPQARDQGHNISRNKRASLKLPMPQQPTHYDYAALCSNVNHRYILIAVGPCEAHIGMSEGGLTAVKDMAEQTIMLLFKTYVNWISNNDVDNMVRIHQAKFLIKCERLARQAAGFAPNWSIAYGANVTSPIFERALSGADRPKDWDPALTWEEMHLRRCIQSVDPIPPHPELPRKTVYRFTRPLGEILKNGQFSYYVWTMIGNMAKHSDGTGHNHRNHLRIPAELSAIIKPMVNSRSPYVIIAFELMHNGAPHSSPFYGFPFTGPYENFDDVKSLGVRVEWRESKTGQWYSASLSRGQFAASIARNNAFLENRDDALRLYREGTAVLRMLRSQIHDRPPLGWWEFISASAAPALVQKLEVDHLAQTLKFVTPPFEIVGTPRKATYEHNRKVTLRALPYLKSRTPAVLMEPSVFPDRDFFGVPAITRTTCDTAMLTSNIARRQWGAKNRNTNSNVKQVHAKFDDMTGQLPACSPCKNFFMRPCLFTNTVELEKDYGGVQEIEKGRLSWANAGKGPHKILVYHDTLRDDEKALHYKVPVPHGADGLLRLAEITRGDEATAAETTNATESEEEDSE